MEAKRTFIKVLGGVLVGGMLLTGGTAYAQGPINENTCGKNPTASSEKYCPKVHHKAGWGRNFQDNLDQMVKDGVISQEKAGRIKAFKDSRMKEKKARFEQWKKLSPEERKALKDEWKKDKTGQGRGGLFSDLVKNNIITQQEADAIKAKMKERVSRQQ